jgi:hypothetical protein
MDVYFCDPASPWQRKFSENAKALLRQDMEFPLQADSSSRTTGMSFGVRKGFTRNRRIKCCDHQFTNDIHPLIHHMEISRHYG